MKKVAILNAFNPEICKGGIETFLLNLKELFSARNVSVDMHYVYPEATLPIKPFPVRSLNNRIPETLQRCFMMGQAFSKIQSQYDLAITNNFYGLGFFSPRIKSISIYHSTHAGYADALKGALSSHDYRTLKYLFGHIGDRLSGRGKEKIAVSQSIREELRGYYAFKDVHVVPHGVDTDFFRKIKDTFSVREKWDIPSNAFVGIFVGRWEIGKGTLIMEKVIKQNPDIVWLLVIGPSDCPLSGYNNVRVIKNADRESLREVYSLSDFMLFPSYYEGFGFSIIEAMACELPVICTQVGVARDFFRINTLKRLILPDHGKTETVSEISRLISFLSCNPIEKGEIAATGRKVIESDYSLRLWQERMSAILEPFL